MSVMNEKRLVPSYDKEGKLGTICESLILPASLSSHRHASESSRNHQFYSIEKYTTVKLFLAAKDSAVCFVNWLAKYRGLLIYLRSAANITAHLHSYLQYKSNELPQAKRFSRPMFWQLCEDNNKLFTSLLPHTDVRFFSKDNFPNFLFWETQF